MSANAFSFYRGTCHLFYQDLAAAAPLPESPITWICGDLHLENFGSFKGDDRQVYFDLNDFDEAVLSPALWEVSRMVTSIFVAFDSMSLKKADASKTAGMFLDVYASILAKGKALVVDPRTAGGVVREFLKQAEDRKQKELLKKLVIFKKNGKFDKLMHDDRHFDRPAPPKKDDLLAFMKGLIKRGGIFHHPCEVLDCIFRVAGTGSVGVKRYMFLLKRTDIKNKYLFVDMKQALPSSLKPYLTVKQPEFASEGDRVIAIQQRMENVAPALLSNVFFGGDDYVLKQMQPIADKIDFSKLEDDCQKIEKVIADMAELTASAQLRSSGRQGSDIADKLIAFGNETDWRGKVIRYSRTYAEQVKSDYLEFSKELGK